MQKMIDNAITVLLGLVIGSLFCFVVQAKAEPPNMYYDPGRPSPHPVQEKSNVNTALDDIVGIFLQNGLSGAIILCLGVWTFRTDKLNRAMQKENIDKFVAISGECSGHMASVSARLENIEREIEQTKAIDMMQMRKG